MQGVGRAPARRTKRDSAEFSQRQCHSDEAASVRGARICSVDGARGYGGAERLGEFPQRAVVEHGRARRRRRQWLGRGMERARARQSRRQFCGCFAEMKGG